MAGLNASVVAEYGTNRREGLVTYRCRLLENEVHPIQEHPGGQDIGWT